MDIAKLDLKNRSYGLLVAWKLYQEAVQFQAMNVFEYNLKPFLIKHNYTFHTWNGDWFIKNDTGKVILSNTISSDTTLAKDVRFRG